MRIRGAMIEDAAGIARVQVDSYRTAYAGIWPESVLGRLSYGEQEQDWRDWISANPDDVLYVAELDTGEIVGYALARCGPTEIAPYDSELIALHVLLPHQRQGWGRSLVATIARELQDRGCKSLMLWVLQENRARRFYERLGGKLLNRQKLSGSKPEVAYGWLVIDVLCEAGDDGAACRDGQVVGRSTTHPVDDDLDLVVGQLD